MGEEEKIVGCGETILDFMPCYECGHEFNDDGCKENRKKLFGLTPIDIKKEEKPRAAIRGGIPPQQENCKHKRLIPYEYVIVDAHPLSLGSVKLAKLKKVLCLDCGAYEEVSLQEALTPDSEEQEESKKKEE